MKIRRVRRAIVSMLLSCFALPVAAGQAAAELSLDRTAVRQLLAAALPEPLVLEVRGLGRTTLRLGAPGPVEFHAGGIELVLPLELVEAEWSTSVLVRLVPGVEPLSGIVRLRPEKVQPALALPFEVDLSKWMEAIDLPRRLSWSFSLRQDAELDASCFLQGMKVGEDRLVLQLGLSLRRGLDPHAGPE